jgi:predicted nucleic acid-binding protein
MHRALVDTGAIYAFVVRTDAHHEEARAFTREFLSTNGVLVLADVVFAETMTLLKARVGADVAARVGVELRRNPLYLWTALGVEGERATWEVFQRYADKEWSYTDCALFVLVRRLEIPQVFAFDEHFDQMPGVVRVP